MTPHVETPQTYGRAGFARADITPPAGIYHRMWGAALHDRATGVHRPLTGTALCLEAAAGTARRLVIGLDHCLLDSVEFDKLREHAAKAAGVHPNAVHIAMSHTHGSAWMSRSRAHLPGGDLIGPYLDSLEITCGKLAADAVAAAVPATVIYGTARCSLATHRDFPDAATNQVVCGFNPAGFADDTVMVAKVVDEDGKTLGTVVNYACHPTTLAWENTLISPDYVGAMREVVEGHTAAPCLFLQGASGDLGPWEGFVGDTAVADRNGRQLGFAALSGLESLPPPRTHFEYAGPVVSGATLGPWKHRPAQAEFAETAGQFHAREFTVSLPYRPELPTEAQTRADLATWEQEEQAARAANDTLRVRDSRAQAERMTRQLVRLAALPEGAAYPFPVAIWHIGHAVWVFTPGELYQRFQIALRERFPDVAVIVCTITDDWQPGYVPPASAFGYGIYQEVIAATAPGSMEALTEAVGREIEKLIEKR